MLTKLFARSFRETHRCSTSLRNKSSDKGGDTKIIFDVKNILDENLNTIRDAKLPVVWVLGGPGSGKGTQCARLSKRYSFKHLSSGDLLRTEVATGSDLGKTISDSMEKGQLVPRDIVLCLLKREMLNVVTTTKGYLIDGYPREIEQGENFEKKIAPCSMILYLKCPDGMLKERLLSRGTGRNDDIESTIMKRIETYHRISELVMEKYFWKVVTVGASADISSTFERCQEHIKILLKHGVPES